MIIFAKRLIETSALNNNGVFFNMSSPMIGGTFDVRCLDPTWSLGIRYMMKMACNGGEDSREFDLWYKAYIENSQECMTAIASILRNLLLAKEVVIYVGSQNYDDIITESFAKYLTTTYGLKPMYIDDWNADPNVELSEVDFDCFDDFSEYGIALAQRIVDTYLPNQGVVCTYEEVDRYGLRD